MEGLPADFTARTRAWLTVRGDPVRARLSPRFSSGRDGSPANDRWRGHRFSAEHARPGKRRRCDRTSGHARCPKENHEFDFSRLRAQQRIHFPDRSEGFVNLQNLYIGMLLYPLPRRRAAAEKSPIAAERPSNVASIRLATPANDGTRRANVFYACGRNGQGNFLGTYRIRRDDPRGMLENLGI